jgi:hypothetical protein
MADYHPLIARAVAGLDKNTGENRRALYERARLALVAQLRGVAPALEESEITRERLSLEEAIRKVEAEAARQARETARPNVIKRPEIPKETPREAAPPPPPRAPVAPPAPSPPRPVSYPSAPPSAPTSAPAPDDPFPPRPAVGNRRTQDDALRELRDGLVNPNRAPDARPAPRHDYSEAEEASLFPAPAQPPAPPRSAPPQQQPPPQRPERHPLEEYGQLEPQIQSENLWALPLDHTSAEPAVDLDSRAERHGGRDETDEPLPRQPSSYGRLIRTTLVLVLIAAVVGLGYWQRDTILGVAGGVAALFKSSGAPPAPREAATPSRPKNTDRIGQPSPQPSSGPPVAQRVVLYEEEPDDPQGKRFIGTVLWRTEMRPATPGRQPELAVRADIDVPERKMSVTLSFRRNTDASLPASHTIEIVFNLPADSTSGGVQKVPGVLMKQAEQTRGVPLAGLAVPVTPGYFLIGLSSLETDMQRNVQLLKERGWFDIPIIYNNNRRAILAMEKGTPGEQAFGQAFAAWKQ